MAAGPEHECRQGRRCKSRIRDAEGIFHGAGVERPNSLCRACEDSAFADIRELSNDYLELAAGVTTKQETAGGPKVTRSADPSVPIQLGTDALMTLINEEAARWARRLPGDGDELTVICSHLGTLVDLPPQKVVVWRPHPDGGDDTTDQILDGVDAVLRLANLHKRAQMLLGEVETTIFLPDPCPHCARKALAVSKDQQRVTCKGCRIVWDSEHFALLSNVLDFERRQVVA